MPVTNSLEAEELERINRHAKDEKSRNLAVVDQAFDVVFGFDMETDVGSFTPFYEGVNTARPAPGTAGKHDIRATFFWTGHAAETTRNGPRVRAGHETGCHGLYHETLGDPIFPLPNNWPILPSEVEGRLREATRIVRRVSGVRPDQFPLSASLGQHQGAQRAGKAGLPGRRLLPALFLPQAVRALSPVGKDWTRPGRMRIVEIPNFCDLAWRATTRISATATNGPSSAPSRPSSSCRRPTVSSNTCRPSGQRPVVCFYLHPWEFHPMPQGWLDFGESSVQPLPFIVKNCGPKALKQLDRVCTMFQQRGARFSPPRSWRRSTHESLPTAEDAALRRSDPAAR